MLTRYRTPQAEHDGPGTKAVAHHTGYRGGHGTHQVIQGQGGADGENVPAELSLFVLQQGHHDTGGHADGLADDLDDYQDHENDPGAMKAEGDCCG